MCDLIKAGNYLETTACMCGVHPRDMRAWLHDGARGKNKRLVEFSQAIRSAEAQAEASGVVRVRMHGQRTWQAEAWFLERRFPERWGRSDRQQPNDEAQPTTLSGLAKQMNLDRLTADELRQLIALMRKTEEPTDGGQRDAN